MGVPSAPSATAAGAGSDTVGSGRKSGGSLTPGFHLDCDSISAAGPLRSFEEPAHQVGKTAQTQTLQREVEQSRGSLWSISMRASTEQSAFVRQVLPPLLPSRSVTSANCSRGCTQRTGLETGTTCMCMHVQARQLMQSC